MSREELAEAVAVWLSDHDAKGREYAFDAGHLGKIERGVVHRPRQHHIAALCAVLAATEAELGFGPESSLLIPATDNWDRGSVLAATDEMARDDLATTRRQAVAALTGAALTRPLHRWLDPLAEGESVTSGGSVLTPPEVSALESLADQLHGWSNGGNGVLARKAVIAQLSESAGRLRDAPAGRLTERAMVATARLAHTAASMSWDAGIHHVAQRYYTLAVQLAKIGRDDALAAVVLAGMGRQCFDLNRPDDGLELVQLAQFGTRRSATPRLRAMLATREAWAYAQQGQVQAFLRTVELAEDHFAEISRSEPPQWVGSFDLAELHGVIGARYRDLALHATKQARQAERHISRALVLRDPKLVRNRVFDTIGLARTHLISQEPEQAALLIKEVLPVAAPLARGRVGVKLADFRRESARYATVPVIRDARAAIEDLSRM